MPARGAVFKISLNVLQLGAVCVGLWADNCAKVLLCWCDGKCVRQLNF